MTFCSMFADDALVSTFSAWLEGPPKKGSVFVDASTVYPTTVKKLAAEAACAGTGSDLVAHPTISLRACLHY